MSRNTTITAAICVVLVGLLGVMISLEYTTEKEKTMFVTSVEYDAWRGATWIYSYDLCLKIGGDVSEIEVGKTYTIRYIHSLPWSKLISLEEL